MKVDAYGNIKASDNIKKRSSAAKTGDFASILNLAEGDDTPQTSSSNEIISSSSLSGMLALQEVSEEEIRRKKLLKQGDDILDSLEQLRRRLLLGTLSMQTLHDITKHLNQRKQMVNDPQLIAIIDDIELRAAVELAKLEMAVHYKNNLY